MFKKIILIIFVFILITGGILGVYFFYLEDSERSEFDEFKNLFPFGQSGDSDLLRDGDGFDREEVIDTDLSGLPVPELRQVSVNPVAGAIVYGEDEEIIRYIERGTGHIFETRTNSLKTTRLSNTTIPKIQKALWTPDGNTTVIQYIDEDNERIETFAITLIENEDGEITLDGDFLPRNITSLSVAPEENLLFYTVDGTEGSIGVTSDTKGENRDQVLASPITEWLSDWPESDTVTLTTKPSALAAGLVLHINTRSEESEKILGGILGLTVLTSPDTKKVILSESSDGQIFLYTYNIKSQERKTLPVQTLPEKCAWSKKEKEATFCAVPQVIPQGDYPDIWYQGLISFSDDIWKINSEDRIAELVAIPDQLAGVEIDTTSPILSPSEEYIIFTNKKDSTLWSLRLKESTESSEEN